MSTWFEVAVTSGIAMAVVLGGFKVADKYLDIIGKIKKCRSGCCEAEFSMKDSGSRIPVPKEPPTKPNEIVQV